MCAINVKQCILHGKYNNSLTFIAQKIADETPLDTKIRGFLSVQIGVPIDKFEFPIPNHFLENQFGISKIKQKSSNWTLQQAHTF
jgi:hypothetical protein